jgi:Cu(I)/Ag(I) efflux system protein CusF
MSAHNPTSKEHSMKVLFGIAVAAFTFAAGAQTPAPGGADHAAHHAQAAPAAEGEVRKVDAAQGKLTLKHGPIANLEMPGMTMVFKVADPKLLQGLKEGDKVKFSAERVGGAITVTAIERAQ